MLTREEKFFEIATTEIPEDRRVAAIWGKAFSLAIGDNQKAQALYIKLRVDQLEREYQASIADLLRLARAEITGGKQFVCPYCESRVIARRENVDFFVQLLFDGPRCRFYCSKCSHELRLDEAAPSKPVPSTPVLLLQEISTADVKDGEKRNNPMALTGFVMGIVSVPFYFIGILPILGVVFSGIGLGTFKVDKQKNKWRAGVGLGLSIVYTVMYLASYGQLG